jgi:hypothetical protein
MIDSTMAHKSGRKPGNLKNGKICGEPSSQKVINTSVSKPRASADGFACRKGYSCGKFPGGPGTSLLD